MPAALVCWPMKEVSVEDSSESVTPAGLAMGVWAGASDVSKSARAAIRTVLAMSGCRGPVNFMICVPLGPSIDPHDVCMVEPLKEKAQASLRNPPGLRADDNE